MLLLKTIVLLGALQGLIVSGLLRASCRFRTEERVSRRLLTALIFWIALACLNLYLNHEPFWTDTLAGNILAAVIPLVVVMPLGPLIYFYIRSCEEPDFRLTRRRRRHFISVVIDLFQHGFLLLFLIAIIARLISTNKYPVGTWEDYYDQYADIPRWISLTIYLGMASRYLKGRRREFVSPDQKDMRRISWLRTLLRVFWAFDLIWLAHLIPYELPKIGDELIDRFDWYPLYIPMVAIIYFLGAKGYFISTGHRKLPAPKAPDKKPAQVSIPEEKLGQVIQALRKSMEDDQIWLDSDLHLGTSFTGYVNRYRIDEVKERIVLPESRRLTIAGLAYECGFNSLPTFQRAFKAITGMSPKEYILNSEFE